MKSTNRGFGALDLVLLIAIGALLWSILAPTAFGRQLDYLWGIILMSPRIQLALFAGAILCISAWLVVIIRRGLESDGERY